MEIVHCRARAGLDWLSRGWRLFVFSPGMWMILTIILTLIFMALGLVPVIGQLVTMVLAPALAGGLLLAAADAEAGRALDLGRLFEPLIAERTRGDILILGLLSLAAWIAVLAAGVVALIAVAGVSAIGHGTAVFEDPESLGAAAAMSMGIGVAVALLIWLLLAVVVTALLLYAVPLVVFDHRPPFEAVGLGLRGVLRNWLPLLILSLIWTVAAVAATIPLLLGWLLLAPVTYGAWYVSYRDIYRPRTAHPATAGAGTGPEHA